MKKSCFLLLTPMLLLFALSVKAQPIRVEAARFERERGDTRANIVLSGPAFPQMIGYGKWNILEARDDRGTDLRPTDSSDCKENGAIQTVQAQPADNIIQVGETGRLWLAPPSPSAKRLVRLRGTFSFYTGDHPILITIPHLKSHLGQKLSAPTLHEAHIQVALGKFNENGSNFLGLQVSGNGFALQGGSATEPQPHQFYGGTNLSDSNGSNLIIGTSGDYFSGNLNGVSARRPIDDAMTLRLRVLTHFQRVEVPFELRDVPLPSTAQMKLDDALLKTAKHEEWGEKVTPSTYVQIQTLLAHGASANARDDEGQTALFSAARAADLQLTRLLLRHGANPNLNDFLVGSSPLLDALLFENDDKKRKSLHEIAMLLLASGAQVNVCRPDIGTPLHMAAWREDLPALQMLMHRGAQINVQRNDGQTALMLAVDENQNTSVRALLAAGANVNIRTQNGDTALKMAKVRGNAALIQLLQQAGARS